MSTSKTFFRVLPALFLSLGLASSAVHAKEGGRRGDFRGARGMFKELNLTAEQKKQLVEIRKGSKEQMQARRQELKSLREGLKEKMKSGASDEDLKKQFSALQSKTAEQRQAQFDKLLQVRSILTPEQRKQLADLAEKRKGERMNRRGGGRGDMDAHDDNA